MRVVAHIHSYYYWEPLPKGVEPTEQDIASRRVKPAANGGYLMRVKRKGDTHVGIFISEGQIIGRIIHELMPNQGCVMMTRQEAIGQVVARNYMPDHAHPSFIKSFEVEDHQDEPDEAAFRLALQPYVEAIHEASGEPLIDPEIVDDVVAKYMEPATNADHVAHLHARFNVKKRPPAADAKGAGQ
jgi:hypothetical protein